MLWAGKIQNRVVDRQEKLGRRPLESAGERGLAQILYQVIAHEPPELTRRNPHISAKTNNFRRPLAGAGHRLLP